MSMFLQKGGHGSEADWSLFTRSCLSTEHSTHHTVCFPGQLPVFAVCSGVLRTSLLRDSLSAQLKEFQGQLNVSRILVSYISCMRKRGHGSSLDFQA